MEKIEQSGVGFHRNMVQFNATFHESQMREIERIIEITGKTKREAVREAIALYINTMRREGL